MTPNAENSEFREIETLTAELATTLRRVDEKRLNAILDIIPTDKLQKIARRPLPQPSRVRPKVKLNVTGKVQALVQGASLLDEPDPSRRMQLFIGFCRFREYSYNTTVRYIQILKNHGVFGESPQEIVVQPSKLAFAESGKRHERMITVDDFVKLFKHLRDNFNKYHAPVLVAVYTGLRTFEILQLSVQTLHQLMSRQEYVSVRRKQTVITVDSDSTYWRPIYTTRFVQFLDELARLYRDEYESYLQYGINDQLFHVTPRTIVNRIRHAYFEVTGHAPPFGFGVHSCRNMMATIMSNETDNISSIQAFLQHKSVKTTQRYINSDLRFIRREFDRLTRRELSGVVSELNFNGNRDDDDDDDDDSGDDGDNDGGVRKDGKI